MYNSVTFSTTSLSDPSIFVVTDDFLSGAPFTLPTGNSGDLVYATDSLQYLRNSTTTLHLDTKSCIKAYGSTPLISEWGDALAITTAQKTNNSLLSIIENDAGPYEYLLCASGTIMCQGGSMTYQTFNQSGSIHSSIPISSCLVEKARQHCRIRFSIRLMSGVIACNILKIICMGYMVWRLDPRPLVTLGDALASFLESPGQYIIFRLVHSPRI